MNTASMFGELHLPRATGDLATYMQAAFAMPMLSAGEEQALAVRFRRGRDLQAAERLILSHLRFVIRIARDYRYYGLAMGDLMQEGTIGLMKAVRHFDPGFGVRLVSYAVHWIRAEIYEFILRNWRIVKVATTKAQRKLFYNLHRAKKQLGWFSAKQIREVAAELGVKPREVVEMERRLAGHDQLYDPWSLTADDDPSRSQSQGYMLDLRYEPMQAVEQEECRERGSRRLHVAIGRLDHRAQAIIRRRWLTDPKATLGELGAEYGVSKERIRQIEAEALKRLKGELSLMV